MTDVTFAVVEVEPEPYAVTPVLNARLGIAAVGDDPIHAIALRCQVRIEPMRRGYSDEEAAGLLDLFGPRERWATTLHNFQWLQTTAMVQGFTGATQVNLPLECTYDFEVAAAKYLHALRDGTVPLQFLFSGTVFSKGPRGFAVQQVPWDREDRFEMPVSVWRDLMQLHYPNTGWLRLNQDTIDALVGVPFGARTAVPRRRGHLAAGGQLHRGDPMTADWDRARAVADAVLYEGYLLYPYRANSRKNQTRWQFGVLGPAGAAAAGIGEDDSLSAQVLVAPRGNPSVSVVVRFLQLQHRGVERDVGDGRFEPVEELVSGIAILAALGRGRGARDLVRAAGHRIRHCRRHFRSRSARAPISRRSTAAGWSAPVVRCTRNLEIAAEHDDGLGAPDDDGAQHRARPPTTKTRRSPCR